MKVNSEYKLNNGYESICRDIANTILIHSESKSLLSIKEINSIIRSKASYYKLSSLPKYSEILRFFPNDSKYKRLLRVKPIKTQSGIAVVTVMPMPYDCPHGKCVYCPGGIEYNTPLSYIGTEPATKVAQRFDYDAYKQVRTKILQLIGRGHEVGKAELVIVGGTFPFYPLEYQIEFAKKCYDALNSFEDDYGNINILENIAHITHSNDKKNENIKQVDGVHQATFPSKKRMFEALEISKKKNETASIRCVGLTIETKPDYCKHVHVDLMLKLGTTRIELGVQALNEQVYKSVNRGHNLKDVYEAFFIARNCGYKIGAHLMPGLPGSSIEQDISDAKKLFEDHRLRPDMLKIYPTLVVTNTGLYELYKKKKYKSYSTEDLVNLLVEIKKIIPPWVRIMRIQREVEPADVIDGPKMGNIRQLVLNKLEKEGIKCKCIRCREIGLINQNIEFSDKDIELTRLEYKASGGKEVFLSFEIKNKNLLFGFLRLRLMSSPLRPELQNDIASGSASVNAERKTFEYNDKKKDETVITSAIVRELHIYGQVAKIEKSERFSVASSFDNKIRLFQKAGLRRLTSNSNSIYNSSSLASEGLNQSLDSLSSSFASSVASRPKYQHKGFGKALLAEAEKICKEEYNLKYLSVISAVGTRDYYRKFGYTNNGPYVTKLL
jgi:elongator complex protein 3